MEDQQNQLFPDSQAQKQQIRRLQFILLVTAVILAAGITWVSIASYLDYEQQARTQLEEQLKSIASLKSSELSVWYRERHGDAEMLKNSPAMPMIIYNLIHNPSDKDSQAKLQLYLETLTEFNGYESYLITDTKGIVLLAFPEAAEIEPAYAHMEEIMIAFKTGQVVFLDFHTHQEENVDKIYLSLIVPIFDEEFPRRPLGSVIMTINPQDYLYSLITGWPVPRSTAETLLVRHENNHVIFLNPLRFKADAALILTKPLEETDVLAVKAVTGHSGVVEGIDYRGHEVIGALQEVTGTPWFMVARIDKAEFLAPIQARKERAIFTTSALLLISFAILILIWRGQQLRFLQTVSKINQELERRVNERTAQLEAANYELEAFAYSVSHDLRSPLRAMGGFSEVLQREYAAKLDDQGKHYLERIKIASNHMGELIDNLLTLSRVTRADLNYENIDLSDMAAKIFAQLQAAEPECLIEVKIAAGLTARGDRNLIQLALENLFSNAWKFCSGNNQARIEVGCTKEGDNKTFYIADNGAGFDMAYSDKLYTPFQRLHGNDEFPGIGIGLSIVSRIINRHGGEIWAEGEVGKGATFYFTLFA